METEKVIEKHEINFPWKIETPRNGNNYKYLAETIRKCAPDEKTIQKEKVTVDFMEELKKIFEKDNAIFLFIHNSQFMIHQDYCILLDVATPEEHSLLDTVVIRVAKKFTSNTFETKEVENSFVQLLYSKENKKRLKKFGLELKSIESYQY